MSTNLNEETKEDCWSLLKAFAPDSISWNHYDLALNTKINDSDIWKTFLLLPEVMEWLEGERAILQRYELAKLTNNVSNSRSVGQAQLINAVDKINAQNLNKANSGPIFIYTYIPLNAEQKAAPNTFELTEDIFKDDIDRPIIFDDSPTLPT